MAKKYLTLEEAATHLSLSKEELIKMREAGDIRGFADRGNWKFKVDDIEELARSRQADSDPDVPIISSPGDSGFLDPESDLTLGGESAMVMGPGDSGLLSDSSGVDEFGQGLEPTDSDVRMVADDDDSPGAPGDSVISIVPEDDSDSDINLVSDADSDSDVMLVGSESDIISSAELDDILSASDSDVRLVPDSDSDVKLVADDSSDSDVKLVEPADSDSDIQLASVGDASADPEEPTDSDVAMVGSLPDADSDIRLTDDSDEMATDSDVALIGDVPDSDSDIRLSADDLGGTDSDVRLVAEDSGSDIALAPDFGSDSDVRLVGDPIAEGSDSDVQLIESGAIDAQTSDSDIALISSDDSAISLDLDDDDDSDSVLGDESGIALVGESSITLASESGISLEGPTDSGISLDLDIDEGITLADDDDSGISLGEAGDSGIALASDSGDDLGGTMPMMATVGEDDVAETQFEIPSLSGEQSDFDMDLSDDDGDTGVIDLADSGGDTALVDAMDSGDLDDAVFDIDDDESAEMDSLSEELELDDEFEDDGDMDDLDVFEDDAEFEEGFQSGESHGEIPIPTRAAAVETEWGTGPFVGLIASTVLMFVVGGVMADLVRSMWSWREPNAVAGPFIDLFAGLF